MLSKAELGSITIKINREISSSVCGEVVEEAKKVTFFL
jgi:hypothetical protein